MDDCLFCKIATGDIPAKKVYEDDKALAFYDINPVAPTHILVIPKEHIASPADITEAHAELAGHLLRVVSKLARDLHLTEGFRIVANCGESAGQSVPHLHLHLLSGRPLAWPPG